MNVSNIKLIFIVFDRFTAKHKTVDSMSESDIIEYTNRHKMEETTAKVFARLHQMKSILYRTIRSRLANFHLFRI